MIRINKEVIVAAKQYLKSENSAITRLIKIDNYNDYPPFYQYTAICQSNQEMDFELNVNGLSLNEEEAKTKAIFEAIERSAFFQASLAAPTYQIDTRSGTTKLSATLSPGLFSTDSCGCAAGIDQESTLNRALLELIERDAFAIYYYNRLSPYKLNLTFSDELGELINLLRHYSFRVHLFDLSLDITIPICLCLLEDTSGIKPYFTLGLKAQTDWKEAVRGAILESLQSLVSFRDLAEKTTDVHSSILRRIQYWLDKKPQLALNFLFKGKKKNTFTSTSSVLQNLWNVGIKKIYYRRIYKKNGIIVIQAAVPELVKLPLDGKALPNIASRRLFSVPVTVGLLSCPRTISDLNTIPHPFP